jgi:hypothetical protein
MNDGLGARKMASYGTMLMLSWSLMPMMVPVAYSQPVPPQPVPIQPVPVQPAPIMTPTEAERAREAERLRQPDRTRPVDTETRVEHKKVRPHETYVAGFGGYTFGGEIDDIEGTGFFSGLNLSGRNRDLADSVVYGGKVGHFFGDRMDWLGVEMEAFNTTPHVEQQGLVPGSHLRVTTLAFNLIGRLKLACETKTERTETRTERAGTRTDTRTGDYIYTERRDPKTGELYTERKDPRTGEISLERKDLTTGEVYIERKDPRTGEYVRSERDVRADREIRYETRYEREFCRLQPYAGVGLGVFFANLSTNGNSVSDNAVPGLNALGGIRYYFTERIALFGEYKYNYATFDASRTGPLGLTGGFKGDYQVNHIVGGLSFHF